MGPAVGRSQAWRRARSFKRRHQGPGGEVCICLGGAFADAGLGSALIQRKQITDDDTTSCFVLNITVGVALAGILCLALLLVAGFYGVPILRPMLCVLSLQLVFASFTIVQNTLSWRDLDYRTLAIVNWSATVLSGATGVVMAWQGFRVWSLVANVVLRSLLSTLLLWALRLWRPRGRFRWSNIRELWLFSSRLLIARVEVRQLQFQAFVGIAKVNTAISSPVLSPRYSARMEPRDWLCFTSSADFQNQNLSRDSANEAGKEKDVDRQFTELLAEFGPASVN